MPHLQSLETFLDIGKNIYLNQHEYNEYNSKR